MPRLTLLAGGRNQHTQTLRSAAARVWPHAVAALLILAGTIAAHVYLAHGLTATWSVSTAKGPLVLATTVEHRTSFPNARRVLARYVQNWNFAALGVARDLPSADAELAATVEIPAGPPRRLSVQASGTTELFVDGAPAAAAVPPGRHVVRAKWVSSLEGNALWRLEWATPNGTSRAVPRSALTPLGAARWPRVLLWLAALTTLGLLALATRAELRRPPDTRRQRRTLLLGSSGAILLLGLALRLFDYQVMPDFRENDDELCATWNGWELLTHGKTRGWTLFPRVYREAGHLNVQKTRYFGHDVSPISPWFDHPPLFHLMVGAAAKLGGAQHWMHARLVHTRLVPIGLAIATMLLLLLVGRRLWPSSAAPILGTAFYATLPYTILQNRAIKEEALLVPLFLASLWLYLRWRDDGRRRRDLLAGGFLAGLAILAKATGVMCLLVYLLLVAATRARPPVAPATEPLPPGPPRCEGTGRAVLVAAAAGLAAWALLPVYAALTNWQAFWAVTLHQGSGRFLAFTSFGHLFAAAKINHNLVGRAWTVFAWMAFLMEVACAPRRIQQVLVVPVVAYLGALAITAGDWFFGWYPLPLWPFLCLGVGRFLERLWARPHLLRGALLIVLPVLYSLMFTFPITWTEQRDHWPLFRRVVTLTCAGLVGPFVVAELLRGRLERLGRCIGRVALVVALLVFVSVNAYIVVRYDVILTSHANLDTLGRYQ